MVKYDMLEGRVRSLVKVEVRDDSVRVYAWLISFFLFHLRCLIGCSSFHFTSTAVGVCEVEGGWTDYFRGSRDGYGVCRFILSYLSAPRTSTTDGG
jgi:hypothetical protein